MAVISQKRNAETGDLGAVSRLSACENGWRIAAVRHPTKLRSLATEAIHVSFWPEANLKVARPARLHRGDWKGILFARPVEEAAGVVLPASRPHMAISFEASDAVRVGDPELTHLARHVLDVDHAVGS